MKTALLILVALVASLAPLPAKAADYALTISIPDDKAEAAIKDLSDACGYQAEILKDKATSSEMIPNPEDRLTFLKRMIAQEILGRLRAFRAQKAAADATVKVNAASQEAAKAVTFK